MCYHPTYPHSFAAEVSLNIFMQQVTATYPLEYCYIITLTPFFLFSPSPLALFDPPIFLFTPALLLVQLVPTRSPLSQLSSSFQLFFQKCSSPWDPHLFSPYLSFPFVLGSQPVFLLSKCVLLQLTPQPWKLGFSIVNPLHCGF